MAKKFGKILTFAAFAGAVFAGIYYFFLRDEDDGDEAKPKENEIRNFFEEMPAREFVSLNREASDSDAKASLKGKIGESVREQEEKLKEEEDGVGLVKEEVDTAEFEFEKFPGEDDGKKDEKKAE